MNHVILMACCLIISARCLFAQNDNTAVKAGEKIKDAVSQKVKFRYPEFTTGSVSFKDGTKSGAPLNLNLLSEEMQFIDANRDTKQPLNT